MSRAKLKRRINWYYEADELYEYRYDEDEGTFFIKDGKGIERLALTYKKFEYYFDAVQLHREHKLKRILTK